MCEILNMEFSSGPSHSDFCPQMSLFLHVQLVFLIPRSANFDSLMGLNQSFTFAFLFWVSPGLLKKSEYFWSHVFRSVTSGPCGASVVLRNNSRLHLLTIFTTHSFRIDWYIMMA